jgi:hypothetical protein
MGHAEHPIRLAGPAPELGLTGLRTGAPGLLALDEVEFVAALEAQLSAHAWPARGWPAALAQKMLGADGTTPRLFQPIHRRFSLAVLDAHCEVPGQPRLDPRRIVARGLVLRRWVGPAAATAAERAQPQHWQAWRGTEAEPLGWRTLVADTLDADPEGTSPSPRTGNVALDRLMAQRIAARRGPPAPERVVPLWPVHPGVAQAVGRTLLFGLVPTAVPAAVTPSAAERAASYAQLKAPGNAQRAKLEDWLSPWFTPPRASAPPRAGRPFDDSWLQQTRIPEEEDRFITFIEQLAYELEAFGENRARWQSLLAGVELWRFDANIVSGWPYRRMDSWAFFSAAAAVVRSELGAAGLGGGGAVMPHLIGPRPGFEPTTEQQATRRQQLLDAAIDGFAAQDAANPMPEPALDDAPAAAGAGGAAADGSRYAVRAFIKVQEHPGCPPRLIWSEPSVLFTIAPWFESTGTLAAPIPMPSLNREMLRRLKPNAGFSLPGDVRRLLRPNGAPAMLAGNPRLPSGGLDWVLQLSIPIMTVCALVAMTIILTLLDAVFRWIPFAWILTPRVKK